MPLAVAAQPLMSEIGLRLQARDTRVVGLVTRRHVELTIRAADRHFWSPHLSLDVFEQEEGVILRGRYAPHPSIWTGLMAFYGVLIMLSIGGAVFGFSQHTLGMPTWGFWALPICAVCGLATYGFSCMGQRLASDQMHELQDFLEECVRKSERPPAAATAGVEMVTASTPAPAV